jgi:hypothetical protein
VTRLATRSPPATARPVASPLSRSPARFGALGLPEPSHHPVCPSHLVVTTVRHHLRRGELAGARHLSPPSPPRAPIKGPPRAPQFLTPASAISSPFPGSIEPAPPSSPSPVSSPFPSLLGSSQISVALELRHFTTSTAHLFPSPITPVGLTGDLTAASARHLAVDRPSRASNDQISPTTVIPYLRSYLATIPSSQNQTTSEEPPSGSSTIGSHRRGSPPDAVTPLSLARGPTPMAPARAVPLLHGPAGPLAPPARAPALAGPKIRPAQLAGNSFSFSFFHFFFLFIYIYIHIHILILYAPKIV